MKDFKSIIGGSVDDVKNTRIDNTTKTIKDESEMMIQKLKVEYRKNQNELEELFDLAPTSTTDLATNLKSIVPTELLTKAFNLADSMAVIARRIKIRVKIHNTLFPNSTVKDLTKEELDFLNGMV